MILIVLILVLLLCALGFGLASFSMQIRRQTLEQAREWQQAHYDLSFYDRLEKTDYTLKSYDGYVLHVQYLKNPAGTDRCVILSHGYTDNRYGALKYAGIYLRLGFDVIIYDLRGHGENEKTFCTYSIREGHDLMMLIEDCHKRFPNVKILGIHGESLGAASTVACLKYRPRIQFAVADCGFSAILPILKAGLRQMHLPSFLVHWASLFAKLRYGYFFKDMNPMNGLSENTVPVLFLHGAEDTFIPPVHSKTMARTTHGISQLHLIPGAGHAESVLKEPAMYEQYVQEFLKAAGIQVTEGEAVCD